MTGARRMTLGVPGQKSARIISANRSDAIRYFVIRCPEELFGGESDVAEGSSATDLAAEKNSLEAEKQPLGWHFPLSSECTTILSSDCLTGQSARGGATMLSAYDFNVAVQGVVLCNFSLQF